MDRLKIGEQLFFQRSDGRIHPATCVAKHPEQESVTCEWHEGAVVKGKEVPLSVLMGINHHLFAEDQPITKASMIPSPSDGSLIANRRSGAGNPFIERMKAISQAAVGKTDIPTAGNREQAGSSTSRLSCKSSLLQARKSLIASTNQSCSNVVKEVNRMKEEREKRRARQVVQQQEKDACRRKDPNNPNWEVAMMLRQYQKTLKLAPLRSLDPNLGDVQQITVCVRKRPLSRKEESQKNMDIITVPTPDTLIVHEQRFKVDLTKYLEHHTFRFDYTFDEKCSNTLVYDHTARPLIRTMFEGGNATCFAYGQTGSGKTHTMGGEFFGKIQDCGTGIYAMAARDVFNEISHPDYKELGVEIKCSFFEIYGTKVYDLLVPKKALLRVLEDGRQQVVVVGLTEMPVTKVEDVLRLIEQGSKERISGQTSANAKSSRSHAVFQIALHMPDTFGPYGKCSFVDLAGNERGADTQSADRQTRIEGAEINKSLLALKECIRALSFQSSHLPFRGSKLTQVLRDSFVGSKKNKTCMIAMISPTMSCVENTLNTLRYADRVKELVAKEGDVGQAAGGFEDKSIDLNNESEPEMLAGDEPDEEAQNNQNSISSAETSSYVPDNSLLEPDLNNPEYVQSLLGPVEVKEVIDLHETLVDFFENFSRSFREIKTEEEFLRYLPTSDNLLEEAFHLVNDLRGLIDHFNTQEPIGNIMKRNETDGIDEDDP
ncbi:kinesin-like protein Klp59C [Drosophila eugracilis]|uniref:kinesin-like protein Klp59C n=1 Tax=Drosophila eugracilis TaxID=29029 RepID=UPI001BD94C53|nr:kinesin-like protein Klp59C [Drosophila eugracilis]